MLSATFLPIVVPVLFWAGYHYYKDRHLPEPIGHLALALLLGAVAAGISRLMYLGLDLFGLRYDAYELAATNLWGLFAYAVLVIGVFEETAKFIPFILVVVRFREFDEPIDGIIYASFIALAYAAIENLIYLQYLTPVEAVARGFAGSIVHILFASIWGFFIGRAILRRERVFATALLAITGASLVHGVYDFIVIALPVSALPLSALLVLVVWMWRMLLIRRLHRRHAARTRGGPKTGVR